jgi:predicted RNA polymerase sigma factor
MFLCCHPALSPDAQVALTLRLLGGLETPEIARAFLVPEALAAYDRALELTTNKSEQTFLESRRAEAARDEDV